MRKITELPQCDLSFFINFVYPCKRAIKATYLNNKDPRYFQDQCARLIKVELIQYSAGA